MVTGNNRVNNKQQTMLSGTAEKISLLTTKDRQCLQKQQKERMQIMSPETAEEIWTVPAQTKSDYF